VFYHGEIGSRHCEDKQGEGRKERLGRVCLCECDRGVLAVHNTQCSWGERGEEADGEKVNTWPMGGEFLVKFQMGRTSSAPLIGGASHPYLASVQSLCK
jgi:hypothetical protein